MFELMPFCIGGRWGRWGGGGGGGGGGEGGNNRGLL